MPTLVGFGTFAALPEEEISEKISRRILSGEHANEQIVWMLKGKMRYSITEAQGRRWRSATSQAPVQREKTARSYGVSHLTIMRLAASSPFEHGAAVAQ